MGRSGNHLFTAIMPEVGKQSANALALLRAPARRKDRCARMPSKLITPASAISWKEKAVSGLIGIRRRLMDR